MLKTVLIITVQHSKPLPELTDLAAVRIYTLQGVEDVTATLVETFEIDLQKDKS